MKYNLPLMHQVKYRLELDRVKVIFGEYKSVMYLNDREHSTINMPGQNIMFDKKNDYLL